MHRCTFSLLLIIVLLAGCNNSAGDRDNSQLAGLCKVWGFLKYYHPAVGSGELSWDSVLIDLIPSVHGADKSVFHDAINDLLDLAGPVDPCGKCVFPIPDTVYAMVDFSWMDDPVFNPASTRALRNIVDNREPFQNHYVTASRLLDASFTNESVYEELDSLTMPYRLLGLFRYWNAIEYFYPYKDLTDVDWDEVLVNMIPQFVPDQSDFDYYLTISKLATHLNDGHSWVIHNDFDKQLLGQYPVTSFKTQ